MPIIEIHHLYKIFGADTAEVLQALKEGSSKDDIMQELGNSVALQDVTLSIEKGETFVVMGLSGSGKSTIIRCLNRLIKPTSGQILVDGKDILKFNREELRYLRRHQMSMVFQRFGLLPHRTILQNVAYGLEIAGAKRAEREEKAMHWLSVVGLKGYEKSFPNELSGGMQQRVGLARALCTDPEILLMDEAFSALDPLIRRQMQNELIELQSKLHKTIVFITHDLDEALRLGDRIAILKDGKVVQVGTPEEILMDPADNYVRDFTQDVNRTRVLTAANAMYDPITVVSERSGPRVAIEAMVKQGLSSVFVVDRERHLLGIVGMDEAVEVAKQKGTSISSLIRQENLNIVNPDDLLEELLPLAATSKYPLAVVDDENHLLGVIPRAAVLAALAGLDTMEKNHLTGNNRDETEPLNNQHVLMI